jgi:nucleoside-diphosphate-sugar epimerase
LITGSQGFTGRYVAAELEAHGWEVWGLGVQSRNDAADLTVRFLHADLADQARLAEVLEQVRPDAVVHLAAIAFVGHGDADAFYRVNLIGTRNLLAALSKASVRPQCVLLTSSANIYGNGAEGMLDESCPAHPSNDYAVSKLAMEHMARLWMQQLPIVLVRPFNYTGVGQSSSFLLPKIVDHFRSRAAVLELGNLDVWRDFSDVRAVAAAYRRLLEVRPAGQTVNVSSGITHSLREVLEMATAITGHAIEVRVNPSFVRTNEVKSLCGNPARLRSLIGEWKTPSLQETLRWMLESP